MSTIKVGAVGGGGILGAHIRGYRAYADMIEVTAVADVVAETAQRRSTELGAAAIVPLLSERTVVRLDSSESLDKKGKWQRVAIEAAKQAWRGRRFPLVPGDAQEFIPLPNET